jgi:hypothetical protein
MQATTQIEPVKVCGLPAIRKSTRQLTRQRGLRRPSLVKNFFENAGK